MEPNKSDFLEVLLRIFEQQRSQGEKTLAQISEADVHWVPDPESNSIAVIVQHLHGNMLSRFTDFLTTDGEKPARQRDEEFVEHTRSLEELKRLWLEGWHRVFETVRELTSEDLAKHVSLRGTPLTVMDALLRAMNHFAYHVGQIVYLGKSRKGSEWKTLSIPKPGVR